MPRILHHQQFAAGNRQVQQRSQGRPEHTTIPQRPGGAKARRRTVGLTRWAELLSQPWILPLSEALEGLRLEQGPFHGGAEIRVRRQLQGRSQQVIPCGCRRVGIQAAPRTERVQPGDRDHGETRQHGRQSLRQRRSMGP